MNQNYDPHIGNLLFSKFFKQSNKKYCKHFYDKWYLPVLSKDFNSTTNTIPYEIMEQPRWRVASQALRAKGIDYTCEYIQAKEIDKTQYKIHLQKEYDINEVEYLPYWLVNRISTRNNGNVEKEVICINTDIYRAYSEMLLSMETVLFDVRDDEGLPLVVFCENKRETVAKQLGEYITSALS